MNIKFYLFLFFMLGSCLPKKENQINLYNIPEIEIFKDNDVENPLNADNIIYQANRIFTYKFEYTDKKGMILHPVVYYDKNCMVDKSIKCVDWLNLLKGNEMKNNYSKIDYIELFVYKTKGHNNLSNSQTIIKYSYFNSKFGKILAGEQTGVVEDSTMILLHPPRAYSFVITEFNPFPRVDFPLEVGTSWFGNITIPSSFWKKAKKGIIDVDFIDFSTEYNVSEVVHYTPPFLLKPIKCYKIKAKNYGDFGNTSLMYFFSPKYGFVRLEYENIDSSGLLITLENIEEKKNDSDTE